MRKTMDREILVKILKEEEYPEHMVENTLRKLNNLQPEVLKALQSWIDNGSMPDVCIEGYTFSKLASDYGMKPIGAFLTLDWLCREPQKACAALQRGSR